MFAVLSVCGLETESGDVAAVVGGQFVERMGPVLAVTGACCQPEMVNL